MSAVLALKRKAIESRIRLRALETNVGWIGYHDKHLDRKLFRARTYVAIGIIYDRRLSAARRESIARLLRAPG